MKARRSGPHLVFDCPGCAAGFGPHSGRKYVPVEGPKAWGFNGDLERPTLTPSILLRFDHADREPFVCHSFVREGRIQFLPDSTHPLAGQTVELPDIEEKADE
jgi:hypothetical protein